MKTKKVVCPDCDADALEFDRRDFFKTVGVTAAAVAAGSVPLFAEPKIQAAPTPTSVAAVTLALATV